MNKKIFVLLAVVAVALGAYLLLMRPARERPAPSAPPSAPKAEAPAPKADAPSASGAASEPQGAKKPRENGWAAALGTNRLAAAEAALGRETPEREMTAAEEKLVEFAHDMAGAGDVAAARKFAAEQLKAEHPKVREAAVFALANCGEPCLAELTPFMADADEGVRIEATSAWRAEWFAMPNDALKADAAVAVMCVLDDESELEPIAAELMKFRRETALAALGAVLEQGTPSGRALASRLSAALGAERPADGAGD